MKVFIAGATGVLGRRVVKSLIAKGHEVTGLARSDENESLLRSWKALPVRADIFDRAAIIRHVRNHDAVLHFATKIPASARPRRSEWSMNDRLRTEGTQNLVTASLEAGVKIYIQESIVHLYNRSDGAQVDETSILQADPPYPLRSAYAMEQVIRKAVAGDGLPAVTLRFGGFYGSDASGTQSLLSGVRLRRLPIIGEGDYVWNLIHLDDAASAVVAVLDRYEGLSGSVFNVVDSSPVTMRELITGLAAMIKAPHPRSVPVPLARLILGSDVLRFMQISIRASNNAVRTALNWTPQFPSFREGIRQVLEEMRD